MATSQHAATPLKNIGILSTVVDAAIEFARGRSASGVLLLVGAALSSRIPGLGVAISVLLRVYRRFS